jgi:hypothetical protein
MMELAKNGKKNYLAVFGDIERSRIVGNREMTQRALKKRLDEVNYRFSQDLAVPFTISMGDEYQGLLKEPTQAISLLNALDVAGLLSFRFGLGWGTVETGWSTRTSEMDGPCFHAARSAIERGKIEERWVTFSTAVEDEDLVNVINGVWRLVQLIRDGWTEKQHSAVLIRRGKHTSKATAEQMGMDKSTLSKMLKAANYKVLIEAERTLELLMRDYLVKRIERNGG